MGDGELVGPFKFVPVLREIGSFVADFTDVHRYCEVSEAITAFK